MVPDLNQPPFTHTTTCRPCAACRGVECAGDTRRNDSCAIFACFTGLNCSRRAKTTFKIKRKSRTEENKTTCSLTAAFNHWEEGAGVGTKRFFYFF